MFTRCMHRFRFYSNDVCYITLFIDNTQLVGNTRLLVANSNIVACVVKVYNLLRYLFMFDRDAEFFGYDNINPCQNYRFWSSSAPVNCLTAQSTSARSPRTAAGCSTTLCTKPKFSSMKKV